MAVEVRIPTLGESVSEGVIVRWIKQDGDTVQTDEPLLELETDKASVEIPAERGGVLHVLKAQGETVHVGDVVARIDETQATAAARPPAASAPPAAPRAPAQAKAVPEEAPAVLSPAVRRLVEEHRRDPTAIKGSGRGGRLTKADVLAHLEETAPMAGDGGATNGTGEAAAQKQPAAPAESEERVPMTHLRQRIAERLVQAQHTA